MEELIVADENVEPVYTLKYQNYIDGKQLQGPCPCPNCCTPINGPAFRFINRTFQWEQQFFPTVLSDQLKNYNRAINDESGSCVHCSLSLYISQEAAVNAYRFTNPKIKAKLDFIAIAGGELDYNDGIGSKPETNGHFSFYEYEREQDISIKFQIVKHLA